eukprot:1155751-Pelagomonas_calceolata.AAC.1
MLQGLLWIKLVQQAGWQKKRNVHPVFRPSATNPLYTPYGGGKCTVCKTGLHKPDHKYCHQCAYSKGLCEMCGKQILDVKK